MLIICSVEMGKLENEKPLTYECTEEFLSL